MRELCSLGLRLECVAWRPGRGAALPVELAATTWRVSLSRTPLLINHRRGLVFRAIPLPPESVGRQAARAHGTESCHGHDCAHGLPAVTAAHLRCHARSLLHTMRLDGVRPVAVTWAEAATAVITFASSSAAAAAAAAATAAHRGATADCCVAEAALGWSPCQGVSARQLAPASAVTSASTRDWLKDRWQAAADMNGTPISGEHWVSVDLGGPHLAVSFVLDWETACADDYAVQALRDGTWVTLPTTLDARTKSTQHVVDTLSVRVGRPALEAGQFRVLIRRPATRWGVSLWRFEIWGHASDEHEERHR